jgi:hypothetical protein
MLVLIFELLTPLISLPIRTGLASRFGVVETRGVS